MLADAEDAAAATQNDAPAAYAGDAPAKPPMVYRAICKKRFYIRKCRHPAYQCWLPLIVVEGEIGLVLRHNSSGTNIQFGNNPELDFWCDASECRKHFEIVSN